MCKYFTCILCPNGCNLEAEAEAEAEGTTLLNLTGNLCEQGREYVERELRDPRRSIASSVLVEGGELPLVSVRLTAPVPKAQIFDVMAQIKTCRLAAPVEAGRLVIADVLGLGSDVVATKAVRRKE